jgi:hypothetical protein
MATSTNYGWSEPDNTSLVKDGAQAIRTLGNAIDTSLWNSGYGQAGKNKIINGSMAVAQRGTTFSAGGYTLDRWNADSATSIVRDTGTAGIPYSIKITNSAGNPAIRQGIELPAAGNAGQFTTGSTWTVSYYAKRSTGTSAAAIYIAYNIGLAGGAPTQILLNTNLGTVTTAWQRFSATFTIAATIGGSDNCVAVVPYVASGAFAGDTWFTGVQLEQGSTATPFQTASGGSIQNELAMCQRYYFRTTTGTANQLIGAGIASTATTASVYVVPPVTMRIAPTSVEAANLSTSDLTVFTNAVTAPTTMGVSTANNVRLDLTGGSGMTAKTPIVLVTTNTSGYLGLSAEL